MTEVIESRLAIKNLDKAPQQIVEAYETWVQVIELRGSAALREYPGYHDEALRGEWEGFRSTRLNLKWRVIYQVNRNGHVEVVNVVSVTTHDYRRKS